MHDLQVGDTVRAKISYGLSGGSRMPPEEGTVVYIHPERRYFTLEFRFRDGAFRESYPLRNAITAPLWGAEPDPCTYKRQAAHYLPKNFYKSNQEER